MANEKPNSRTTRKGSSVAKRLKFDGGRNVDRNQMADKPHTSKGEPPSQGQVECNVNILNPDDGIQVHVNTDEFGKDDDEDLYQSEYESDGSDNESNTSEVVISSATKRLQAQEKVGLKALFTEFLQETLNDPDGRSMISDMMNKTGPEASGNAGMKMNEVREGNANSNRIKSPSDTTIYAPALKNHSFGGTLNDQRLRMLTQQENYDNNGASVPNDIANFVEAVRLTDQQKRRSTEVEAAKVDKDTAIRMLVENPDLVAATKRTKEAIVEAERHQAELMLPPGKNVNRCNVPLVTNRDTELSQLIPHLELSKPGTSTDRGLTDDDFFHLTCHVDEALKQKIEKGFRQATAKR